MELTKIVVGVDFSPQSEVAVTRAIEIARRTGAEVCLVHVGLVLERALPPAPEGSTGEWERLVSAQLAQNRAALSALRERHDGQGADLSQLLVDGYPDTGLVAAAEQIGAQLIITGSHGRTGVRRWLLGSVSERTVRLSSTAVMVARGDDGAGFRRILVPTDFSGFAERALRMAVVLAAPDARIDLVHYWQLPMVSAGGDAFVAMASAISDGARDALESDAERRGRKLVEAHGRSGIDLRFELVQAGAAHGIVDRLERDEDRYDVCVMGSHGRRGVRRFILGSVAESVVRHAPCSVLVVHGEDPA